MVEMGVKLLLKSGGDINARTRGGATPLHRAAYQVEYYALTAK